MERGMRWLCLMQSQWLWTDCTFRVSLQPLPSSFATHLSSLRVQNIRSASVFKRNCYMASQHMHSTSSIAHVELVPFQNQRILLRKKDERIVEDKARRDNLMMNSSLQAPTVMPSDEINTLEVYQRRRFHRAVNFPSQRDETNCKYRTNLPLGWHFNWFHASPSRE